MTREEENDRARNNPYLYREDLEYVYPYKKLPCPMKSTFDRLLIGDGKITPAMQAAMYLLYVYGPMSAEQVRMAFRGAGIPSSARLEPVEDRTDSDEKKEYRKNPYVSVLTELCGYGILDCGRVYRRMGDGTRKGLYKVYSLNGKAHGWAAETLYAGKMKETGILSPSRFTQTPDIVSTFEHLSSVSFRISQELHNDDMISYTPDYGMGAVLLDGFMEERTEGGEPQILGVISLRDRKRAAGRLRNAAQCHAFAKGRMYLVAVCHSRTYYAKIRAEAGTDCCHDRKIIIALDENIHDFIKGESELSLWEYRDGMMVSRNTETSAETESDMTKEHA